MAINGIGAYGIAGPARKRTNGLQQYQNAVQEGANINAYNSMGVPSATKTAVRGIADHAVAGGGLQQSWRNQPEATGQFNSLVANRGLNYGPDPRYPVPQNFGTARQPTQIPGTYAANRGQSLGRGLMTMGGAPDPDYQNYPRFTEGNVLPSGTGVSYDPVRGSIALRGAVSAADFAGKKATVGPAVAAELTNGEALQAMRDRYASREQSFRDGRIMYNAQKYGLPAGMPAVAGARMRSDAANAGGLSGKQLQQMHLAQHQADVEEARAHNKMIDDEIMKIRLANAGAAMPNGLLVDEAQNKINVLENARKHIPRFPGDSGQQQKGLPSQTRGQSAPLGGGVFGGIGASARRTLGFR